MHQTRIAVVVLLLLGVPACATKQDKASFGKITTVGISIVPGAGCTFDADGHEVVADLLPDAIPVVSFSPHATGEYRIGASMVTCSVEPCAFRIVPFAKGEGIGPGGVMVTGTIITDATHQGTLQSGDEQLREGEYFDEYPIQARSGQTIIVDLRSGDFDTYLILESPGGSSERNDDFGEDTGHSHIEMVATEGGTFSVVVTSFSSESTGDYILRLMVVEGS